MAASSSTPETNTFLKIVIEGAERTESFFSASIYRVPGQLRKLKESAYTPLLVSIGPFHKDLETPQARDLKMWYVNSFVGRIADRLKDSRSISDRKADALKKCKEEMTEDVLDKAKKHYAEKVGDKLTAEMLVVDGCFILEILCRYKERKTSNKKTDCPIFNNPLIRSIVQMDLLLLENQIPFFVLETLGQIMNIPPSVKEIIHYFHNVMVPTCCKSTDTTVSGRTDGQENEPQPTEETKKGNHHILQILHDHKLPKKREGNNEENSVPSASELEYSGVKFLAGSGQDLSEINFAEEFSWFCRAKFTIPRLSIDDTTERVLRNLIAFEQCNPNASSRYFSSYAFLMDKLVNSEKDVEVLEKANVIHDTLGSKKDVCDLLNNIAKEIDVSDFIFVETCKSASKYSDGEWSKFMAQLRRKWFASPWTFIAFCIAGLAFGMQITKFIYFFLNKRR